MVSMGIVFYSVKQSEEMIPWTTDTCQTQVAWAGKASKGLIFQVRLGG